MSWNIPVFDSTGKIKDARVGEVPALTASGTPLVGETTAVGSAVSSMPLFAFGTPSIGEVTAIGSTDDVILLFPRLGTNRQGSKNFFQSGSLAEDDRHWIGQMDACILGGFLDSQMDENPPPAGWVAREVASQEILDAHPTSSHYLYTYLNHMETADESSPQKTYLDAVDGPGSSDGWVYDDNGDKKSFFGGSFGINFTDNVAVDGSGDRYPEWHTKNIVQPIYIDPHITAGIGFGKNGINGYWDNYQLHANKTNTDWDFDGTRENTRDFYDSEDSAHVAADPNAVTYYSQWRVNSRKGLEQAETDNPGFLVGGNTNQWAEGERDEVAQLRNIILEFRLDDNDAKTHLTLGFSENISRDNSIGYSRSGVGPDGVKIVTGGTWMEAYLNAYLPSVALKDPGFLMMRWRVECLQSGTTGAGGQTIYPNTPASNSIWHMFRWSFANNCMSNSTYCCSGIVVGSTNSGNGRSTPVFDEFGLINGSVDYGLGTGGTKLFRKCFGAVIDPVQTGPFLGNEWRREFENFLVIANDSRDNSINVNVSTFPGGSTEWMRFNGDQDSVTNDGTDANSNFTINKIDAIFLVRKSWYEAL